MIDLRSLLVAGVPAFGLLLACSDSSEPKATRTHPSVTSVDSLPAGGAPYGVAISKSGRTWVSGLDGQVVSDDTLPLDTFDLDHPITFLSEAPHIVFNPAGDRAYVTLQSGEGMAVVDVASHGVLTTLPLGHDGFNLITSRGGTQIYVSTDTGLVYAVDAGTNQIIDTIALGPAVNGFARHPTQNLVYISSRDSGYVVEVDAGTHAIARTFHTGGRPQRLAVSPDGHELLVANEDDGLQIWDLRAGVRDTTMLGTAYGLGLSPDGQKAYITDAGGNITIVDRVGRSVDTVLTVGGSTRNVAFDATGETAVITNQFGWVTVVR